ncbi:MAG: radical SAM protein [Gemmatimonadales bacterium]
MTIASVASSSATGLFSDLDQRWEGWYRDTYGRPRPEAPLASPPIEATPEGLEREILVKASLLADGVRLDPTVLEGVASVYREQSRWLFDWNQGEHEYYLPEEILLPMDTIVQIRENKDSRWLCRVEDGVMLLEKDGAFVMECRQLPRPTYYGLEASPGVIMRRVAPKRGQDCMVLNYAPFCMYWSHDQGCRFCNIVPNMQWTKDDLQVAKRNREQIVATTRAAFDEGCVKHILLTGGYMNRRTNAAGEEVDREDEMVLTVVGAMQEALERHDIPVNVIRTAPEDDDLKSIERHKAAGVFSVAYNLEVWDPVLFDYFCPGKSSVQGREHWLRALEVAAEVYGPGRVSTHLVTGFMEPPESVLEGVEWLSSRGIATIPLVWSPVEGTRYAGFRAPRPEWFVEMVRKIAEIRLKHGVDAFEPAALPNDCPRCAMPTLIGDELRRRKLERETAAV